jgi:hypothetical protein
MFIEPRQAQRGRGMSAGAERQPRIERHHDRVGRGHALVMRADPQPPPEAHGVKVPQPLALPGPIGHLPRGDAGGIEPQGRAQRAAQRRRIRRPDEQAAQARRRPQTELAGGRLEHRVIGCIDEGDRTRTARPAGLLGRLRIARSELEFQL